MRTTLVALVAAVATLVGLMYMPTTNTQAYYPPVPTPIPAYPGLRIFLPMLFRDYSGYPGPGTSRPTATSVPMPSSTPLPTATPTSTPTRTATPTATATATAIPCDGAVQVISDPGFEEWPSPWTSYDGSPFRSTTAYTGSYSAVLGVVNNYNNGIAQMGPVPSWAETAALYFVYRMRSDESIFAQPYDYFWAEVYSSGSVIAVAEFDNLHGRRQAWDAIKLAVPDIASYRGQNIAVLLSARNDNSNPTTWYVDNVRLNFACGSTIAETETTEALDIPVKETPEAQR